MKKWLLCILVALLVPLWALAQETPINTREALVAYLTDAAASQPGEIPFDFDATLYDSIADSDWMGDVLSEAGIFSARWSYGRTSCTLKEIDYMPFHYACTTEAEVVAALQKADNGAVNIRLSPALYDALAGDFSGLYALEGEAGIQSRAMSYYSGYRLFLYTEVVYAENLASVSTVEELQALLRDCRVQGKTAFSLRCSEALFDQLTADDFALLHRLEGEAGMLTRSMLYYTGKRMIEYSEVDFAANFANVSTLEELRFQLRLWRLQGTTAFTIQCTGELFDRLAAEDFALLHALEGEAGFSRRTMSYYAGKKLVEYTDVVYAANFESVSTLEELKAVMQRKCLALEEEFTIHCAPELYALVSADGCQLINVLESNCGMYARQMMYFDGKQQFVYSQVAYYPGYRIARLLRLGREGEITGRDQQLLLEARQILQEAVLTARDRVELQEALQGAVMSRVTYFNGDGKGDHDNAYGALLNGSCECDGYADAFYLLADMAGFEVCFQHGDDVDAADDEAHLWSMIAHDGRWYFTDLTWCDADNGDHYHLYANIGRDMAQGAYRWDDRCSLHPLAETTDPALYHYDREGTLFDTAEDAAAYVSARLRAGSDRVELLLRNAAGEDPDMLSDRLGNAVDRPCRYIYNATDGYMVFIFYPKN